MRKQLNQSPFCESVLIKARYSIPLQISTVAIFFISLPGMWTERGSARLLFHQTDGRFVTARSILQRASETSPGKSQWFLEKICFFLYTDTINYHINKKRRVKFRIPRLIKSHVLKGKYFLEFNSLVISVVQTWFIHAYPPLDLHWITLHRGS